MRSFFALVAIIFTTVLVFAARGDEVRIPADLVQQLFDHKTPNQLIKKRPFDFEELQSVVHRYGTEPDTARELTRRYLKISYAAGEVDVLTLARIDLPMDIKSMLLKAPAGSIRFALSAKLQDLLNKIPQPLLVAVFHAPKALIAHDAPPLVASELLALNSEHYSRPAFYDTQTPMHSENEYYSVSYPRRETHMLGAYLEWDRARTRSVTFVNAGCRKEKCITPYVGESFASFEFRGSDASYPQVGQRVEATCRYQAAYRREYESRSEIEFAFEDCTLETLDGEAPVRDPLLEDLRRVTIP